MRAQNACLLRYKSQLVMTPGYLFHKGQPRPTSSGALLPVLKIVTRTLVLHMLGKQQCCYVSVLFLAHMVQ